MTRPNEKVKPEPTQADRERADAFIESITEQLRSPSYGDCSYEHIKPGSDDALASELAAVREEAYNAGANEMVERCREVAGRSKTAGEAASKIIDLSPDPNYLQGKIAEATKELREAFSVSTDEALAMLNTLSEGSGLSPSDAVAIAIWKTKARQALKETGGSDKMRCEIDGHDWEGELSGGTGG